MASSIASLERMKALREGLLGSESTRFFNACSSFVLANESLSSVVIPTRPSLHRAEALRVYTVGVSWMK